MSNIFIAYFFLHSWPTHCIRDEWIKRANWLLFQREIPILCENNEINGCWYSMELKGATPYFKRCSKNVEKLEWSSRAF